MSNIQLVEIKYNGATESIHCEKLSDNIYKCLESCLFIDFVKYGCEIEVEEVDGKINFLRLFKEPRYEAFFYVWSKEIVESNGCKRMKDEIIQLGGFWENAMSGVFIIHLPKDKVDELDRLFEILKAE
jgi:hypothetical protein